MRGKSGKKQMIIAERNMNTVNGFQYLGGQDVIRFAVRGQLSFVHDQDSICIGAGMV